MTGRETVARHDAGEGGPAGGPAAEAPTAVEGGGVPVPAGPIDPDGAQAEAVEGAWDKSDIDRAEAYLDALASEAERRVDAEVAAMEARGEAPAPTDGLLRVGLPLVWAALRWEGPGVAEVRLAFQDEAGKEAYAWGEPYPRRGEIVPAAGLLGQVCEAWPALAAWRLVEDPGPWTAPEGAGLPFEMAGGGGDIRIEAGGRSRQFGAEGVLLVEVLSGLADILAGGLPGDDPARARWERLRAMTDLPPIEIEGDGPGARDALTEQTAWYARRLGVPAMPYSLAAVRVQARQVLHGMRGAEEPAAAEWDPAHVPEGLAQDDVLAVAREAAGAQGVDVRELMREAVVTRNMDARQRILYGRGAGPGSAPAG